MKITKEQIKEKAGFMCNLQQICPNPDEDIKKEKYGELPTRPFYIWELLYIKKHNWIDIYRNNKITLNIVRVLVRLIKSEANYNRKMEELYGE